MATKAPFFPGYSFSDFSGTYPSEIVGANEKISPHKMLLSRQFANTIFSK